MALNRDLNVVIPLILAGKVLPTDKYKVCEEVAKFNEKGDSAGLKKYTGSLSITEMLGTAGSAEIISELNMEKKKNADNEKRIAELEKNINDLLDNKTKPEVK